MPRSTEIFDPTLTLTAKLREAIPHRILSGGSLCRESNLSPQLPSGSTEQATWNLWPKDCADGAGNCPVRGAVP